MILIKTTLCGSQLRAVALTCVNGRMAMNGCRSVSKIRPTQTTPWIKLFSAKSDDGTNKKSARQTIDVVDERSQLSNLPKQDLKLGIQAATSLDIDQIPGTSKGGSRQLAIIFTCKVCDTRSAKKFTERAYNHGVVLVRCPKCNNLHLIADRLGYFSDDEGGKGWDIEMFMKSVGQENDINVITEGQEVLEVLLKEGADAQSQGSVDDVGGSGKRD